MEEEGPDPPGDGRAEGGPEVFQAYPASHVLAYDGLTGVHYLLGAWGIVLGYGYAWWAFLVGIGYLVFSFLQMCVLMPLVVCPNCAYPRSEGGRCISGNDRLSRRIGRRGSAKRFGRRAEGVLCHNNLYIASLVVPIGLMVPALVLYFSWLLLGVLAAVVSMLLVRFLVLFPKVACVHCLMRRRCPNAEQMGLS